MLQDEYRKIMEQFKQTIEGDPVKLEDLCQNSLEFFQKVQDVIQTGTDKEKKEAVDMMSDMYQSLLSETKHLTENVGMTEEQLMNFAENSNNFDPSQWKLIQETRETMSKTGESLTSYVKESHEAKAPKAPKTPRTPLGRTRKKRSISKKDNWLRS